MRTHRQTCENIHYCQTLLLEHGYPCKNEFSNMYTSIKKINMCITSVSFIVITARTWKWPCRVLFSAFYLWI